LKKSTCPTPNQGYLLGPYTQAKTPIFTIPTCIAFWEFCIILTTISPPLDNCQCHHDQLCSNLMFFPLQFLLLQLTHNYIPIFLSLITFTITLVTFPFLIWIISDINWTWTLRVILQLNYPQRPPPKSFNMHLALWHPISHLPIWRS
jgi:hypothetical protein